MKKKSDHFYIDNNVEMSSSIKDNDLYNTIVDCILVLTNSPYSYINDFNTLLPTISTRSTVANRSSARRGWNRGRIPSNRKFFLSRGRYS